MSMLLQKRLLPIEAWIFQILCQVVRLQDNVIPLINAKSQPFELTPLMNECETELKFKISGRVEGLTPRAIESIKVLNLGDTEQNNRSLIEKRKQLSHSVLLTNGINPDDGIDDDELIEMLVADIECPKDGKLEAYAPVVVNILRGWLSA